MTKILIIGREKREIPSLARSLSARIEHCAVMAVRTAAQGTREARSVFPDAVVVDRSAIGRAESLEVLAGLRTDARTGGVPVLMVGGVGTDSGERIEALTQGADVFLAGPLDPEAVAAQVYALLRIKRAEDALRREKIGLEHSLLERKQALEQRTHDLAKRVKELNCLYAISELRESPDITLEEILQGVADLIPASGRYPETTCARILLGYQEFKTDNFKESPWKQSCDILIHGEWAGSLEVFHTERPEGEGAPFLKEEKALLKAICERLGRVAERVQAEEALRLESANIMNILRSMEDWVYKINDHYDIEYVNPALRTEFGPIDGRKCYEYFYDRREACPGCEKEAVLQGKTVRGEYHFSKNGKTYDVINTLLINSDGSRSKLSILRDLTAIKQAQKALEERELLYRSVTESTADGAVMVQDGRILFANHALVNMFGYVEPAELAGAEILEFFDRDFRELFRRVFDPAEQDGNLKNLMRGVCVTRDGRKFWVSTNRSVIRLKSKPAILATMRDVTEDMAQESSIQEVAEHLQREIVKLRSTIKERYRFGDIVGKSLPMQQVYELILRAAGSDANVIVLGESGTGKELVSRAIHYMSARADKAFVPVNCGAIPENLVESEFFGHRKGAFTGAYIDKTGYLHTAHGGTLFLDEVGELGLNIQVKLLRALESGEYKPVGDTQVRRAAFRIICATNQDFRAMVGKGRIREDFYYRISVIPILLPPLRERKEDIPLLIEHFLKQFTSEKRVSPFPGKVMEALYRYDWPGNVRELQGLVQRYLAVGNFEFLTPGGRPAKMEDALEEGLEDETTDLRKAREIFEKRLILKALHQNKWHRGKVAAALNIDPKTLYTKMKKIGLA